MSVEVEYDGTVCIRTDEGVQVTLPLRALLDSLDEEGLEAVIEHVTEGAILDKAVERLCGDAAHYQWPADQRRARKVLLAMERRVLGSNLWGAFDETERAIREAIMEADRLFSELPYSLRSDLIDVAHGRAARLRKLVSERLDRLVEEVRGEEAQL